MADTFNTEILNYAETINAIDFSIYPLKSEAFAGVDLSLYSTTKQCDGKYVLKSQNSTSYGLIIDQKMILMLYTLKNWHIIFRVSLIITGLSLIKN